MTLARRIGSAARRVPQGVVYAAGLVPAVWIGFALFTGRLGVDPVEAAEHRLGLTALQFLIATLAVTPLMRFAGIGLIAWRRPLGLLAFTYAVLHFAVWLTLDMQLYWGQIAEDLVKRWYIVVGMVGLVAMVPLAWTSRDSAIRRMGGAAWRRLHRLAYVAAAAGALHYLLLVKTITLEPLIYAGMVAGLLALRAIPRRIAVAPGAGPRQADLNGH
jgi:sulfoxide reductase heme-binding subunit YedZ